MKKDNFLFKNWKMQKSYLQRIILLFIVLLLLTIILSINFIPNKILIKEGEVSPKDIMAPETVEFIDEKATMLLKEEATKTLREVYNLNLASIENTEEEITQFFSDITAIQERFREEQSQVENSEDIFRIRISETIANEECAKIKERYLIDLECQTIINMIQLDQISLREVENIAIQSVRKIMQQGVKESDIEEARKQIVREISEISSNPYIAMMISEFARGIIRPSLFIDEEATESKRQEILSTVGNVTNIIRKDQIIVRKGEIVTTTHMEKLRALGLQNPRWQFQNIIGMFLFNTLVIFLLIFYIVVFQKPTYADFNQLILLSIIYLFTILIAKISGEISGFLIPIGFATMLIAITIDTKLALWVTFMLSYHIGFIFLGELNYMAVAMFGGLIAVFSIRKATQRSSLTRAGLFIAAINVLSITSLGLIHKDPSQMILENSMWGILNGFVSAVLTLGILPFLEGFFDITSSFRLMELSNPNQPLLKQLLVEAPGTYHHSVVVGNLSEAAAEEINANALLARVGAYYHDVGKIKRPYFFAENQEAYKNTHDDLEPSLSALVIASHVKDGIDMAKKYKLPKLIIDIINQHHGTGLISYFFHRALQANGSKSNAVNEESYRYSGPKPQTKEAGIILLADSLEAEARTLNNPTSSRIKNLTQTVISRNLENGQLDDCNLTLRDLNKIKDVFSRILTGMFHSRIEYPDEDLINKLKKERSQGEGYNKKQPEQSSQSGDSEKNTSEDNDFN